MGARFTSLIQSINYCCPWAFLKLYRRTGQIALRLGVDRKTVQRWKQRFNSGELSCENCSRCLRSTAAKH